MRRYVLNVDNEENLILAVRAAAAAKDERPGWVGGVRFENGVEFVVRKTPHGWLVATEAEQKHVTQGDRYGYRKLD